jgi:hypothetical protein
MFTRALGLGPGHRVLDLGSEDGSYLGACYPYPHNVVLADIDEAPMRAGVARYGLGGYRVIPPEGRLPFADGEFDAVWCNSVIEHVTLGRADLAALHEKEFAARADAHQQLFATEIARVGQGYFVQTPYVHFPVEAHAWMPFVQYLPQQTRWRLSRSLARVWIKQWRADYNLYDIRRFRAHFPDGELKVERVFGLPKSLIAIRPIAAGIVQR